jgi:pSer/pThr/pTyr-binding forkhead associated (FHA) protein
MAFVVVSFRGEEVTRRELDGPLVIGRSPECDICVRDILLSRRHCRIDAVGNDGWSVEDLASKNGTRIHGEVLQYAVLKDGTSIRIGKTHLRFHTGKFSSAPRPKSTPPRRRPSDPFEAQSSTVAAFEFVADGPMRDLSRLPTPRPQPADPDSYSKEDVYTMLSAIASSSWDSIYETASGPAAVMVAGQSKRPLPVAGAKVAGTDLPPRRRQVMTDPSLQVIHPEPVAPSESPSAIAAPVVVNTPPPSKKWLKPVGSMIRGFKRALSGRFLRRAG